MFQRQKQLSLVRCNKADLCQKCPMKLSSHSFFRWTVPHPPSIRLLTGILFQLFREGQTKQPVCNKLGAGGPCCPYRSPLLLNLSSFILFLLPVISLSFPLSWSPTRLPLFHNPPTICFCLSNNTIFISDKFRLIQLLHRHAFLHGITTSAWWVTLTNWRHGLNIPWDLPLFSSPLEHGYKNAHTAVDQHSLHHHRRLHAHIRQGTSLYTNTHPHIKSMQIHAQTQGSHPPACTTLRTSCICWQAGFLAESLSFMYTDDKK